MRNAIKIGELFATTDNAAAIGEKPQDVVSAPDQLTAYFTARVTFLEQLAANALPSHILLANFSGDAAWSRYVAGIQQVFDEAGLSCPPIDGSTESNMATVQSGLSITMLGEQQKHAATKHEQLSWYTYGLPLVGNEILAQPEDVAQLQPIFQAWKEGIVQQVWPVGSKGLQAEFTRLFGEQQVKSSLDVEKSAGPCAVVLLGIQPEKEQLAQKKFPRNFEKLRKTAL
ncbi:alpha-ribazole-5-phosphate synthase [Lysinibacillus sp. CTST325]